MFVIETPDEVVQHMEPIDIENGKYQCWDANGRAVQVSIAGQRVRGISHGKGEIPFGEAFKRYTEVYGLDVDSVGPFEQMRTHLKEPASRLGRGTGLLSKLFKRGST